MDWGSIGENLLNKGIDVAGDIMALKYGQTGAAQPASTSQAPTPAIASPSSGTIFGMPAGTAIGLGLAAAAALGLIVVITRR